MAQARVLADLAGEALDLEGRRLGVGEQLGLGDLQLELARRQVGVDRLLRAADDRAGGAQHVLGAELVGRARTASPAVVGVEDELDDAGAVAQVDEDQAAVVAAAVDPAGDPRLGVDAVAEHLAAPGVAVPVRAQGRERSLIRLSLRPGSASPVSTARCSPLSMSRSCAEPSASRMTTRRAPIRSACLSWPLRPRPARSTSAESPALRSSLASASARRALAVVGGGDEDVAPRRRPPLRRAPAGSARSRPPSRPPGVGRPPSCSIRPS